jgi:hypothetical protein
LYICSCESSKQSGSIGSKFKYGISDSIIKQRDEVRKYYDKTKIDAQNQHDNTKKLGSETIKKTNTNFPDKDGTYIIKGLNKIGDENRENEKKIDESLKKMEKILKFLDEIIDVDNNNRVREQLINETIDSLKRAGIREQDINVNELIDLVNRKSDRIVNEQIQMFAKEKAILSFYLRNERTIAAKIYLIDTINHFLKGYIWQMNNDSYFDTGSDDLKNKDLIEMDVSIYIDSMFKMIIEMGNIFVDATVDTVCIEQNIFVTGYTDGQGWKGIISKEENQRKNLDLSKRRADRITETYLDIYKNIYHSKIGRINNRLSFTTPIQSIEGLGETLPDINNNYKINDPKRRITKLKCRIIVK